MAIEVFDVAVIGAGPGGLTAAIYGARAGLKTVVVGGASSVSQVTVTDMVENYPGFPEGIGGYDLLEKFRQQVLALGVEILPQDVQALSRQGEGSYACWEIRLSTGEFLVTRAAIAATGTSWRRLQVPGEEEFLGKGVSFCATCDGPLYRGKNVVVVGGGSAAVQEALFLANFVAKVTLVHRRAELRADKILQRRAFSNNKIEFLWNSVVAGIAGEKTVSAVVVRDAHGGEMREVPANGVFVFIGFVPNTAIFQDVVQLAPSGAIIVDSEMATSASGIFACGDCVEKSFRQVVTACGEGALAAHSVQRFLEAMRSNV